MIYVVGARGRLGQSLVARCQARDVIALDRQDYDKWWQNGADLEVSRYFERAPLGSIVVVPAGVLDPSASAEVHQHVNVDLPRNLIEGATRIGLRVVTFGTIMEQLAAHSNPYVRSKAALGRFVAERVAGGDDVLHLQVHTLFGVGQPSPHMFLGQMLAALKQGQPFEMTPGRQLREYHHVEDDVSALQLLLSTRTRGVVALSHGEPRTLHDIAIHVFESLGRLDLLRLGARPEPPDDNYVVSLPRLACLDSVIFRPTLPAVANYMQRLLLNQQV